MGKKQHQKDKLYLTSKEWKEDRGGLKKKDIPKFFRLPFECCCLSFHPYKDPCCNKDGFLFDLLNVVPFIEKFGIDPISGEQTTIKELIKLNIAKNSNGKFQ
ncbi:hypothetical protein HZS_1325 [Henneguya salminicola]|uniref:RING-type E3 ubiquitin transferase n=1 Tax=Henneguya salminicola TaxID=69463 RepID=A0A6G3MKY4_HENSL|nr:hypothetical protein HZS_1325 [Henneguya salminicola]